VDAYCSRAIPDVRTAVSTSQELTMCNPSMYNVISGQNISYGFRCAEHRIFSRRFSDEAVRDDQVRIHQKNAKKSAKKN
jgi:hypothetical protein